MAEAPHTTNNTDTALPVESKANCSSTITKSSSNQKQKQQQQVEECLVCLERLLFQETSARNHAALRPPLQ